MLTQPDKFHQRIHDQGHVLFSRIHPGTRPRPIRWMIHEAATEGIVVNVIDHRPKHGRFSEVAIISAASPPETDSGTCPLGWASRRRSRNRAAWPRNCLRAPFTG